MAVTGETGRGASNKENQEATMVFLFPSEARISRPPDPSGRGREKNFPRFARSSTTKLTSNAFNGLCCSLFLFLIFIFLLSSIFIFARRLLRRVCLVLSAVCLWLTARKKALSTFYHKGLSYALPKRCLLGLVLGLLMASANLPPASSAVERNTHQMCSEHF